MRRPTGIHGADDGQFLYVLWSARMTLRQDWPIDGCYTIWLIINSDYVTTHRLTVMMRPHIGPFSWQKGDVGGGKRCIKIRSGG